MFSEKLKILELEKFTEFQIQSLLTRSKSYNYSKVEDDSREDWAFPIAQSSNIKLMVVKNFFLPWIHQLIHLPEKTHLHFLSLFWKVPIANITKNW